VDEKLLAVRKRLRDDFSYYAQHCLTIRTVEGNLQRLFPLNPAQQLLMDAMQEQMAGQGYVRVLILKARQQGFSTLTGAYMFSQVTQRKGAKAFVGAHDAETTEELFQMVHRYYENLPEIVKPSTKYSSKRELSFSKLDSAYEVANMGGKSVGRGFTLTHMHGSEVAYWPKSTQREIWNGVRQSVADVPGTFIALESTANGCSGLFYDLCQLALQGRLPGWKIVFSPWFLTERYQTDVPDGFKRTIEENKLVELAATKWNMELTDRQLAWRRKKIAEGSVARFQQEFPATPTEAFLASGLPVFQPHKLAELLDKCPSPDELDRRALEGGKWLPHEKGPLTVYRVPEAGESFIVGADVGAGIRGGDYSVAQVLDSKKRLVATYRGHVVPDEFGRILANLGEWYNTAKIICENNNHGQLTTYILREAVAYPNLYSTVNHDKETDKQTETTGFTTTVKSRPLVLDQLRAAIRDDAIDIKDAVTLGEMRTFIVTEAGKMEAEPGSYDDTVMALAFAHYGHSHLWRPIENDATWYLEAYY
jgi:hypothetical protein